MELSYLSLLEERSYLIKSLKLHIKNDINTRKTYECSYIKNIEDFTEYEITELVDSIYSIIFYRDLEIVNLLSKIKELCHDQELSEAISHDQYPIHQIEINRLQHIVNEYIKKRIPIKFQTNYEKLIYYIYDLLENPYEDISDLITNIYIKSNEICDTISREIN